MHWVGIHIYCSLACHNPWNRKSCIGNGIAKAEMTIIQTVFSCFPSSLVFQLILSLSNTELNVYVIIKNVYCFQDYPQCTLSTSGPYQQTWTRTWGSKRLVCFRGSGGKCGLCRCCKAKCCFWREVEVAGPRRSAILAWSNWSRGHRFDG